MRVGLCGLALLVASGLVAGCGSEAAAVRDSGAGLVDAGSVGVDSGGRDGGGSLDAGDGALTLDAGLTGDDASSAADAAVSGDAGGVAIELCGNRADDDGDGLVDEDCAPSLFAGVYPPGGASDPELAALEAAAPHAVRVVQTYRSMTTLGLGRLRTDLDAIWAHGSIPHANIEPSGYSAAQYASAATDPGIDADAHTLATTLADALAARPDGRLFLTFGAEMNGNWVDWGCMPAARYIALYRKVHDLVSVAIGPYDTRRVRWVYGPNNTSSAGCGSAGGYYPGHGFVDYLGMSSYRSGAASVATTVIDPAHALFDALSFPATWRADRFVVLQTGARVATDRDTWIATLYAATRDDSVFAGVIWFDDADWAVAPGSSAHDAWTTALAALPPSDARLDGLFLPFFWDVRMDRADYSAIQALRAAGATSGCSVAPPLFCPEDPLPRRDVAVLLVRAFRLPLDPGVAPLFTDVAPSDTGYAEIQTLARAGALSGCGAGLFCPSDAVTEVGLRDAIVALGGPASPTMAGAATRARAAVAIARGAALPTVP